jgi:hypothetical protein
MMGLARECSAGSVRRRDPSSVGVVVVEVEVEVVESAVRRAERSLPGR